MKLFGKSQEEIAHLVRNKRHDEMVQLLYQHASLEPHFSARTIAAAREMSKRRIVGLMQSGGIRPAHKPMVNGWRASLSAVREWDERTRVT